MVDLKPAFRPARPASGAVNLAKTLAQTAVFWFVFLAAIPFAIVWLEGRVGLPRFEPLPPALTWSVFALASALGLASGATMALLGRGTPLPIDAPRELVVRGPYRFVRNPMAIAGLTQGACVGAALGSWSTLAYVALGFVLWNWFVRPVEERDLERRFGPVFVAYRDAVRCWVPRLLGVSPDELVMSIDDERWEPWLLERVVLRRGVWWREGVQRFEIELVRLRYNYTSADALLHEDRLHEAWFDLPCEVDATGTGYYWEFTRGSHGSCSPTFASLDEAVAHIHTYAGSLELDPVERRGEPKS